MNDTSFAFYQELVRDALRLLSNETFIWPFGKIMFNPKYVIIRILFYIFNCFYFLNLILFFKRKKCQDTCIDLCQSKPGESCLSLNSAFLFKKREATTSKLQIYTRKRNKISEKSTKQTEMSLIRMLIKRFIA